MTATTIPTFEEVWSTHKNLIYKLANQFNAGNEHRSDLVQCGRIGIYRAIQTYQPEKGGKFISWMITHVKKEMINYLNDNLRTIRIPVSQLRQQDRETFPTENVHSLDDTIYDDAQPLYSTIEADNEEYTETDTTPLKKAISMLKPQWQTIMTMVSEGYNNTEIAKHLGISKEAVRQQRDKAVAKLREIMVQSN